MLSPAPGIPNLDTSLASPSNLAGTPEAALSPTKAIAELAADARRERKVLDLEISNSSLLAINASLEREVRRQKTELKRFRRLSRAGHLGGGSMFDRTARLSEGLSTLGEEDDDEAGADADGGFGPASGLSELYDMSDDSEDGSSLDDASGSLSPDARAAREQDRLAKDQKRLRVDLERHKELLVQSQMMNQSLKRCMYATEEMIREANKALQYHVRVSDVKLGGRILTGHEEDDLLSQEVSLIEEHGDVGTVEQTTMRDEDGMESAKDVLDVWSGIGRGKYGSEVSADRDSGIEVDRVLMQHGLHVLPSAPESTVETDTTPDMRGISDGANSVFHGA